MRIEWPLGGDGSEFPLSSVDEMVRSEFMNHKRASRRNFLGEKCELERQL